MPARIHAEMVAHALAGLPNEACGLITGPFPGEEVTAFFAMTNVASSSTIYRLDVQEMINVEQIAERSGDAVVGVMHSHTHTTGYPSPTDVEDASRFDPFGAWRFVIVSLALPDPSLRCFRIIEREVIEERVEVVRC